LEALTTKVEYQHTKQIPIETRTPITFKTILIVNNNLIKEAIMLYAKPEIAERAIV